MIDQENFAICKPGDIVFLNLKVVLSNDQLIQAKEYIKKISENLKIKIVILPDYIQVSKIEKG